MAGVMNKAVSGWGRYPVQSCELTRPERYAELIPSAQRVIVRWSAARCAAVSPSAGADGVGAGTLMRRPPSKPCTQLARTILHGSSSWSLG